MRKTYRVYFIDHQGYYNQKLLEADSVQAACEYMFNLGYIIDKMEEVAFCLPNESWTARSLAEVIE